MAKDVTLAIGKIGDVKIANVKELNAASAILDLAIMRSTQVETFAASLRERVQQAAEKFREIEGFEDFEVTLTIRKWGLKNRLLDGITRLRNARAKFNADEQEKLRRAQLAKDAEQDRLNKIEADKAAAAAKKAGASKETVQEIRREVLATPAPIVESKTAIAAENAGAGLRYQFTADITNVRTFLQSVLANEDRLKTLGAAREDMESAFRNQARDQKEQFGFPGITYRRTPVDVRR
jgi:heme-degrading monooxygenase HmoA